MYSQITINNLNYSYDTKNRQLKDINMNIMPGEVVVLIGKSGCGKSSITRVINGLIPHFYEGEISGETLINNNYLNKLTSWQIGKLTGNVFQNPKSQFFANEVAGEIAFGCENYGLTHDEIVSRVKHSARNMSIEELLDKSIHTLSYGMRQKVAIASAQAINPKVFIMDEPSANLDIESTELLAKMIKKLKKSGKTVVIAEHRLYYLTELADRYLFIQDGEIIKEFKPNEILNLKEEKLKELGLRITNLKFLKCNSNTLKNSSDITLEVLNVSKKINKAKLLDEVSFKCYKGEVIALVGANGAGKSTLGRILAGLLKSTSGVIRVDGNKLKKRDRLNKIWYIPQDLDSQLFGEDLLDELITGLNDSNILKEKAKQILIELDLDKYIDKHPSTLSGGQKQRLALGVALIYDPSIIILDEPTSGLDGFNMRRVSKIIKDMSMKGKTTIIITHDAEFALNVCGRVIKLEDGKLIDDYELKSASRLLKSMGYKYKKEVI